MTATSIRRLYRVTATYPPGVWAFGERLVRHYITKRAALDRAVVLRRGWTIPGETWEASSTRIPPALSVTIEESEPVVWPATA